MGFGGFESILKQVKEERNNKEGDLKEAERKKTDISSEVIYSEFEENEDFKNEQRKAFLNEEIGNILNEINNSKEEQNGSVSNKGGFEDAQQKAFFADKKREHKVGDGHRKRARERFLLNPDGTSDYDFLELLLFLIIPRADTKPIARALIDKFKTIGNIFLATNDEITACGVNGEAVKYLLILMKNFYKRLLTCEMNKRTEIKDNEALKRYCFVNVGLLKEEEFHILYFDNNFRIIKDERLGFSDLSNVAVSFREVIKVSLNIKANNVVLYHNHPNGDVEPTKNDIDTTKKIADALKNISVRVCDHLIISGDKCFSFVEHNLI